MGKAERGNTIRLTPEPVPGTRIALSDGRYGHVVGQLGELLSVDVLGPTGAGDRVLVRRDEATVID